MKRLIPYIFLLLFSIFIFYNRDSIYKIYKTYVIETESKKITSPTKNSYYRNYDFRYIEKIESIKAIKVIAKAVRIFLYLKDNSMLNEDDKEPTRKFYVSDTPESFLKTAKSFLNTDKDLYAEQIKIENYGKQEN